MIELQSDIGLKKTRGRGNFEIKNKTDYEMW